MKSAPPRTRTSLRSCSCPRHGSRKGSPTARLHLATTGFAERLAHYFFVAVIDDEVVGYSQGEIQVSDESVTAVLPIGTRFVEITNLYVAVDRRQLGLGGKLLGAVLSVAKRDGVDRSLLFTGTKDVLSIARFYQRHGFDGWGIQMVR